MDRRADRFIFRAPACMGKGEGYDTGSDSESGREIF